MDYLPLTHELVDQLMDGIIMRIRGFDKNTRGQCSTAAKTIGNAAMAVKSKHHRPEPA